MKSLIMLVCTLISGQCLADKSWLNSSVEWIAESLPDDTLFDFASEGLRFSGCKHREYEMRLSQPINQNWLLDSRIGYAKGKLNWGVFSQQVSMYEWSIVPRYQFSEQISIGGGLIARSEVTFKTTQGQVFDLPRNNEWLVSSRITSSTSNHYWELSLSSQKWQASSQTGTWFERGLADNKISLAYIRNF